MTLNLAQRSSKVVDFVTNRKRVCIFLLTWSIATLDPIFHHFRDNIIIIIIIIINVNLYSALSF